MVQRVGLKQVYNEFYHIYADTLSAEGSSAVAVITEDSNAGYEFFESVCDNRIPCNSAGGKSNIVSLLRCRKESAMLIIADGAAFGSECAR